MSADLPKPDQRIVSSYTTYGHRRSVDRAYGVSVRPGLESTELLPWSRHPGGSGKIELPYWVSHALVGGVTALQTGTGQGMADTCLLQV
jgi:hypothetical protein